MPSVSVILPVIIKELWQKHMTTACIQIMRETTKMDFELLMVETESTAFGDTDSSGASGLWERTKQDLWSFPYLHRPQRTSYTRDFNATLEMATGDLIVQTGNDIFVKPGWLDALLECFERMPDCGAASLRCAEVGAGLNPHPWAENDGPPIIEGWYGPLLMFRRGWRFDEAFEVLASDNDLIMRLYHAGHRAYVNRKVVPLHLYNQTLGNARDQAVIEKTAKLFREKWGSSPYWAATMMFRGGVIFGREFER